MKKWLIFLTGSFCLLSYKYVYCQTKLSIQGGIAFPAGNFSSVANNGFGACGTLEFPQDQFLSITGALAYYYWGPYSEYNMGPADSYSNFQIMLGIRYAFSQRDIHPYIGVEIGMNSMNYTHSIPYSTYNNFYQSSISRIGISPAFGVILKVNDKLNFDINLKYNAASTEVVNNITYPANFFVLNAGLQFGL